MKPTRHLDVEGVYNMRDLGGYPTSDGRQTRWKTFVRSGSMHAMQPAAQSALVDYGIRTVIDLRRTSETEEAPNVFAGSSVVAYHHQNMLGDQPVPQSDALPEPGTAVEKPATPAEFVKFAYTAWLDGRQPQIGKTLATLAEPASRPAAYHCAGGKDRTGIVSALLLGIAGVPEDVIAEDYALSARYLMDRYYAQASPGSDPSDFTWEDYQREYCPADGMRLVLEYLNERYGGIEPYVRSAGLNTDQIDSLRTALVE